eukprot:1160939-Pelagomonas_calceolata.AAC.10
MESANPMHECECERVQACADGGYVCSVLHSSLISASSWSAMCAQPHISQLCVLSVALKSHISLELPAMCAQSRISLELVSCVCSVPHISLELVGCVCAQSHISLDLVSCVCSVSYQPGIGQLCVLSPSYQPGVGQLRVLSLISASYVCSASY